jgi:sugar lactone lactonase YvrE
MEPKMPAKKTKPSKSSKRPRVSAGPNWVDILSKYKKLILWIVGIYVVLLVAVNYFLFVHHETKKDLPAPTYLQFTGLGKSCGEFEADGVASVGDDQIAVADKKNHRILIFDQKGDFIRSMGELKAPPRNTDAFQDVTSDDSGNLYVVDEGYIRVYDLKGENVQSISLQPMGCYVPRAVSWSNNHFLLADTGGQRILKISATGELQDKWGSHGDCKECFNNPTKAILDTAVAGNFYVPDYDNMRVKYMDGSGKTLKVIKLPGRPVNAAVDKQGNLFVASPQGNFIKVYGPQAGSYEGDLKDTKGIDNFGGVQGLAFAADGTLLLAENNGINELKVSLTPVPSQK